MFISFLQEKLFWKEFKSFCTINNMDPIHHITWYNKTIDLFKFYQRVQFVGGYRQVSSPVLKIQIVGICNFFGISEKFLRNTRETLQLYCVRKNAQNFFKVNKKKCWNNQKLSFADVLQNKCS